jgi:predicted N-formylglutamate amidohydrolase
MRQTLPTHTSKRIEASGARSSAANGGKRYALILSCEYGSNEIPCGYSGPGLTTQTLGSYVGWDPGAAELAQRVANALRRPLHVAPFSRVFVDVNRSQSDAGIIPRVTYGLDVPGNIGLTPNDRERRLRWFYHRYRRGVQRDIEKAIRTHGCCLHLAFRTFPPLVGASEGSPDVGISSHARRSDEKRMIRHLYAHLHGGGYVVQENFRHPGAAGGFVTHCRTLYEGASYFGLEIHANQVRLADDAFVEAVSGSIAAFSRRCYE